MRMNLKVFIEDAERYFWAEEVIADFSHFSHSFFDRATIEDNLLLIITRDGREVFKKEDYFPFKNINGLLRNWARAHDDSIFIYMGEDNYSWVYKYEGGLAEMLLSPGSRIYDHYVEQGFGDGYFFEARSALNNTEELELLVPLFSTDCWTWTREILRIGDLLFRLLEKGLPNLRLGALREKEGMAKSNVILSVEGLLGELEDYYRDFGSLKAQIAKWLEKYKMEHKRFFNLETEINKDTVYRYFDGEDIGEDEEVADLLWG